MIKDVKYGGLTNSPSDYESPDGDIACILGAVPEQGSLSPVLPPQSIFDLDGGSTVCFVHETAYIRNYIIRTPDNAFSWRTESGAQSGQLAHTFVPKQTIHQVNAIGNTLIILSDDGMHYFLWRGYADGYLYLGTHMPELDINFGLQSCIGSSATSIDLHLPGVTKSTVENGELLNVPNVDRDNITTATEAVLAEVNKYIASDHQKLREVYGDYYSTFKFPFLVRYAYRLYDGSLVMHSAPVLMPCNIADAIFCMVDYFGESRGQSNPSYSYSSSYVRGAYHFLDYCASSESIEKLNLWKDIIKSVDIFVSKQFYTYDQNGSVLRYTKNINSFTYCRLHRRVREIGSPYPDNYQRYNLKLISCSGYDSNNYFLEIPRRKTDDVLKEIQDCHTFYFLHSVETSKLQPNRTIIYPESGYIQNITAKEVMDDDYNTHNILVPEYCYGYNSRLILSNIKSKLFGGFDSQSSFVFTDKYNEIYYTSTNQFDSSQNLAIGDPQTINAKIFYYIKQDNKDFITSTESRILAKHAPFIYLYHPNRNAYKAVVGIYDEWVSGTKSWKYFALPMVPHETLNGAVFFQGLSFDITQGEYEISSGEPTPTPDSDSYVEEPNKLYTSEVNNPFYFPVLGINTIGTGQIYSIRSAAKALSQGQFGQFPLYAFTSEGVWALEVASNGTFAAKQPITRDVCINPDSITQLDDSVLFATDRGIMLISGSQSTCITESLDYQQTFDITTLPHIDQIIQASGVTLSQLTYVQFHDFLKHCRMLYSYTLQRIYVYSTDPDGKPYPYAYVYSLKSKSWGMTSSSITSSVPSYPEALAVIKAKAPVTYSVTNSDPTHPITQVEVIQNRVLVTLSLSSQSISGSVFACIGAMPRYETQFLADDEDQFFINAGQTLYITVALRNISGQYTPLQQVSVTATDHINQLVDYSKVANTNPTTRGLLVTRPLKLDMPDVLKTVYTVIQRGNFAYGHVKSAIYGSRDMANWILICTSTDHYLRGFRGNPYKYFRLLSIFDLNPTESLFGATVQFVPKFQNRLR